MLSGMRTLFVTLVFAVAGLLVADLQRPAAAPQRADAVVTREAVKAAPPTVQVAFVRNGRLVLVERTVPKRFTPEVYALNQLVRGPTWLERRHGVRTALGEKVRLRSIRADGDSWHVSFSRSLFGPSTHATVEMRLRQIEATIAPLGPEHFALIAAEGRFVTVIKLGGRPAGLTTEVGEKGYPYSIRGIQLRLWTLGYLAPADISGTLDYATEQALLAFQGWEGLHCSGTVTGETQLALLRAERPRPTRTGAGRRVEIHRDIGVLLLLNGNDVVRAVHTSTGAYGKTPAGSFHVYRKDVLSWSVPFKVWMPYASYFTGGIAMHEYAYVPGYPASHGCVRLPAGDAQRVYDFVEVGTPVYVI